MWRHGSAHPGTALTAALVLLTQDSRGLRVTPIMTSPDHSRVGAGFPVALQRNSASCPGCTVSCGGCMETTGAVEVPETKKRGEQG